MTDTLRRAASLMRKQAEAVGGPWHSAETLHEDMWHDGVDADFVASWHPAVALAVADWLDCANEWAPNEEPEYEAALAVARAYLGESS